MDADTKISPGAILTDREMCDLFKVKKVETLMGYVRDGYLPESAAIGRGKGRRWAWSVIQRHFDKRRV